MFVIARYIPTGAAQFIHSHDVVALHKYGVNFYTE